MQQEMLKTNCKPRRKIIIDFEVLSKAKFWLCCMKDVDTGKEHTVINNRNELMRIYYKNIDSIWIGYNIKGYDQWIFKSIIAGINPYQMSDILINTGASPAKINIKLIKVKFNFFELGDMSKSLKELELYMGESIKESTIPFDLPQTPTLAQVRELEAYCKHDVNMTYEVFKATRQEYDSHEFLIDYYKLNDSMFKTTKAQLSAHILGAKKPDYDRNDEFDFKIVNTIKLKKYKYIMDWYLNPENRNYKKSFNTMVYGVSTEFGWGGLHSARKKYKAEGHIYNSDVASFYPSIMIEYGLLSRNVSAPEKFTKIRDTRLKFKAVKDSREKPFKIVLNGTFGASKDKNNELYDPQMANAVCVNGQLMLLDLIEKVEERFGDKAILIQANTDGVMFKFESEADAKEYLSICDEWSKRTRMGLDHDSIKSVVQKDVNNYIVIKNNGKMKNVGGYVKDLSLIDNDLPIINKALKERIINNIPVRETIEKANNLIDFQKRVKAPTGKNSHILFNGEKTGLKVQRAFAAKHGFGGNISAIIKGQAPSKVANAPVRVFFNNDNIKNTKVPECLDKEWYISVAEKRLEDFMPGAAYEYTLFDMLG